MNFLNFEAKPGEHQFVPNNNGIPLSSRDLEFYNNLMTLILSCSAIIFFITTTYQSSRHMVYWHTGIIMMVLVATVVKFSITDNVSNLNDPKAIAEFIYSWLLPPIVLQEGFFSRKEVYKKAEGLWSTGVWGTLISTLFTIFCLRILAIIVDACGYESGIKGEWEFIIILTIGLNSADFHGALAPFHALHNKRMERLLASGVILNNQIALIFSQTLDRAQDSQDYSLETIFINLFKSGVLSLIFGLLFGLIITLSFKK